MAVGTVRTLRNESTEFGREVWRAVDKAANAAPEWMKAHVREFLQTTGAIPETQVLKTRGGRAQKDPRYRP